jgi:anti-anti-sigma factor
MNSPKPREEMDPISVAVFTNAGAVWIQIRGELDVATCDDLQTALQAVDFDSADGVHLMLDQLTFCDTGGARILLLFEREARLSGRKTTINGANPMVRKILTMLAGRDQPTFA